VKTLSVVVPVYYNEASMGPLFQELRGVKAKLLDRGVALELIFVDDGSGDGSFAELLKIKAARPATKVVKLSRNFGAVQASWKTVGKFVTGDGFVILAADLQDPPGLILDLVDRWLAGCKFVMCMRRARKDPPLMRPRDSSGFSRNSTTCPPWTSTSPNRPGACTVVTVPTLPGSGGRRAGP
jgi:dolichol-phosphate mannosyltransferase